MDHSPFEFIRSGTHGRGSSGSMSNPMYKNVCATGVYEPLSGRCKRRAFMKQSGERLNKAKKFWEF